MKYRGLNVDFTIENCDFTMLSVALEKLDYPMPSHAHSANSYEIHYVSYGEGTLNTDSGTYDITPGTLFITGPYINHEQISNPDNPMTEYCIYIQHKPGRRTGNHSDFVNAFFDNPFWIGTADSRIHETIKEIVSELEHAEKGYEYALKALLSKYLVLIIRKYNEESQNEVYINQSQGTNNLTYLMIEEAFLYDYKDITLEKLSELLNLSTRQTERLLKLHYNKTFLQKKTEARMSAAINMLRETDKSVLAISYDTGYSTGEHLAAALKKYTGLTATQIRKSRIMASHPRM